MSLMKSLKKDHNLPPMAPPQGPVGEPLTIEPVVTLNVVQTRTYPANATPEYDVELVATLRAAVNENLDLSRRLDPGPPDTEKSSSTAYLASVAPKRSVYMKAGGGIVADEWVEIHHSEAKDVAG